MPLAKRSPACSLWLRAARKIGTSGNQKLIPYNGHKYTQEEEREVGWLAFVSRTAKPY